MTAVSEASQASIVYISYRLNRQFGNIVLWQCQAIRVSSGEGEQSASAAHDSSASGCADGFARRRLNGKDSVRMADEPTPDPRVVADPVRIVHDYFADKIRTRPKEKKRLRNVIQRVRCGDRRAPMLDSQQSSIGKMISHGRVS